MVFLSDEEHYLELLMRISGGKRLSLPSPNPADNPLVRCGTVKIAQNAANVINEAKRSSEAMKIELNVVLFSQKVAINWI